MNSNSVINDHDFFIGRSAVKDSQKKTDQSQCAHWWIQSVVIMINLALLFYYIMIVAIQESHEQSISNTDK